MYFDYDDFESDVPIRVAGFTGIVRAVLDEDDTQYVILFGREDNGKSAVLKVRLAAHQDPIAFTPGRTVRVTEMVGKMGRELVFAFPATTSCNLHNIQN